MILTEFDPSKKAVINPEDIVQPVEGMPEIAIACYSNITFDRMLNELNTEIVATAFTINKGLPHSPKGL